MIQMKDNTPVTTSGVTNIIFEDNDIILEFKDKSQKRYIDAHLKSITTEGYVGSYSGWKVVLTKE